MTSRAHTRKSLLVDVDMIDQLCMYPSEYRQASQQVSKEALYYCHSVRHMFFRSISLKTIHDTCPTITNLYRVITLQIPKHTTRISSVVNSIAIVHSLILKLNVNMILYRFEYGVPMKTLHKTTVLNLMNPLSTL